MGQLIPVPTLSPAGWVTSPAEKADTLLSHLFLSLKSQSFVYGNNVSSIQGVIEQYGHDITVVTQQMGLLAEAYLRRYYDVAIATVTNNNNATNLTSSAEISIHVQVTENGITYSLGKLLQISNSKITKIITINNG